MPRWLPFVFWPFFGIYLIILFSWIARESTDEGKTWKLTGEFFLRRVLAETKGRPRFGGP